MLWLMSSLIPYSTNTEATFENFIAACPICGFGNIFNRASDFRTFEPVDFREVHMPRMLPTFQYQRRRDQCRV
jgi:hypothetical protein